MSYLTDAELESIQHLPRDTPYGMSNVSQGFFSIARHYGCAKYNGQTYTYIPETDELFRDDVLKFIQKARKTAAKEANHERRAT